MNTLRSENFHTWETIGRKAMQRESRRMERERGRVVKVGWDFEQKYLRWRLHQPINCSHCLQCIKWVSGPDWIPLRLLGLFEHLRCYQWKDKGASFYRNPTEYQQFQKCKKIDHAITLSLTFRVHSRFEMVIRLVGLMPNHVKGIENAGYQYHLLYSGKQHEARQEIESIWTHHNQWKQVRELKESTACPGRS